VLDRDDHCVFAAGPVPAGCPEAAPPAPQPEVTVEPPPVDAASPTESNPAGSTDAPLAPAAP
jgi:hypothetical protein